MKELSWNDIENTADAGSIERELGVCDIVRIEWSVCGKPFRGQYDSFNSGIYGVRPFESDELTAEEYLAQVESIKEGDK